MAEAEDSKRKVLTHVQKTELKRILSQWDPETRVRWRWINNKRMFINCEYTAIRAEGKAILRQIRLHSGEPKSIRVYKVPDNKPPRLFLREKPTEKPSLVVRISRKGNTLTAEAQ